MQVDNEKKNEKKIKIIIRTIVSLLSSLSGSINAWKFRMDALKIWSKSPSKCNKQEK